MPAYFKIDKIDGGYSWQDFDMMDVRVEYATEVLDIPEEYFKEAVSFYGRHIEITLVEDPSYALEDWYYALMPYVA